LLAILALTSVPAMLAVLRVLARRGCSCLTCHDVRSLLATVRACVADLVLLDARLGGSDIESVLTCISAQGVPRVAVLGGEDGLPRADAVEVLDPSWPPEVVGAHLSTLLADRRCPTADGDPTPQRLSWGDLRLDQRSRQGFQAAVELHLTRYQFRLLWKTVPGSGRGGDHRGTLSSAVRREDWQRPRTGLRPHPSYSPPDRNGSQPPHPPVCGPR
jgi:DNA-binding response OmpR family regulator